MIYKGQTWAFIIWKLPDVFAFSSNYVVYRF